MNSVSIYSVVGYSNTGKTTLLEKLIPELKSRGLRIAVMKHDAHEIEIDKEGKDTWRMTQAGADVTIIASDTKAAVLENRPTTINDLISRIENVDVILIEGCKHDTWKKIALYRTGIKQSLTEPLDNLFAVMSDQPIDTNVPCLDLNDASGLADLILSDCSNHKGLF